MNLNHEYANVNGVRLHFVSAGDGDLILFLHGFPEFWYAWHNQLLEFGRTHRAVAVDMRGYNLSSKPEAVDQYRMSILIEDIRSLIEHLGYRKCVLVAHDWGGAVAWSFAAAHPEWLDKLIIINAPHPAIFLRELRENPAQQRASAYMLTFRSPEAEQILSADNYSALVRAVLSAGLEQGVFAERDRDEYLKAWSQPGALTGGLNYYRASGIGPPRDSSPPTRVLEIDPESTRVDVPTLVIWGEKDVALLVENLNGLEAFVPDLTIRRIPDGTHWVVHEQPDLVNRCIREFI